MGTDIDGWIECRREIIDDEGWIPAIDLGLLYLGRDYRVFGNLFGIRNRTDIQPLAAERGLPDDVSEQVRKEAANQELYGHTWISWTQVKECVWEGDMYWKAVVSVSEILATIYGDENVRLVVWFED